MKNKKIRVTLQRRLTHDRIKYLMVYNALQFCFLLWALLVIHFGRLNTRKTDPRYVQYLQDHVVGELRNTTRSLF